VDVGAIGSQSDAFGIALYLPGGAR
jgi:hypothetical protein